MFGRKKGIIYSLTPKEKGVLAGITHSLETLKASQMNYLNGLMAEHKIPNEPHVVFDLSQMAFVKKEAAPKP